MDQENTVGLRACDLSDLPSLFAKLKYKVSVRGSCLTLNLCEVLEDIANDFMIVSQVVAMLDSKDICMHYFRFPIISFSHPFISLHIT